MSESVSPTGPSTLDNARDNLRERNRLSREEDPTQNPEEGRETGQENQFRYVGASLPVLTRMGSIVKKYAKQWNIDINQCSARYVLKKGDKSPVDEQGRPLGFSPFYSCEIKINNRFAFYILANSIQFNEELFEARLVFFLNFSKTINEIMVRYGIESSAWNYSWNDKSKKWDFYINEKLAFSIYANEGMAAIENGVRMYTERQQKKADEQQRIQDAIAKIPPLNLGLPSLPSLNPNPPAASQQPGVTRSPQPPANPPAYMQQRPYIPVPRHQQYFQPLDIPVNPQGETEQQGDRGITKEAPPVPEALQKPKEAPFNASDIEIQFVGPNLASRICYRGQRFLSVGYCEDGKIAFYGVDGKPKIWDPKGKDASKEITEFVKSEVIEICKRQVCKDRNISYSEELAAALVQKALTCFKFSVAVRKMGHNQADRICINGQRFLSFDRGSDGRSVFYGTDGKKWAPSDSESVKEFARKQVIKVCETCEREGRPLNYTQEELSVIASIVEQKALDEFYG